MLGEARTGLEQVKQAVVDYVSAQWDTNRLADVPALLAAVKGALAMVPLAARPNNSADVAFMSANELVAGNTPDWTALDAFADAISGIDYYLERLCEDAAHPGDEILSVVERSLTQLGYGAGSERALRPAATVVHTPVPTARLRRRLRRRSKTKRKSSSTNGDGAGSEERGHRELPAEALEPIAAQT